MNLGFRRPRAPRVVLLVALFLLPLLEAFAEDVWILKTGPEAVTVIPLDPVQPVDAWRGSYSDSVETFWVYLTRSPHFVAPAIPSVLAIPETPWTLVAFFPARWTPGQRTSWVSLWTSSFRTLASLPQPGWPIVLPSVLRKG